MVSQADVKHLMTRNRKKTILSEKKYKDVFEEIKGVIRILISKEEQTKQWPKEKVQKDKQRSTQNIHIKLKIE